LVALGNALGIQVRLGFAIGLAAALALALLTAICALVWIVAVWQGLQQQGYME
jgi:hypothetical protein